MSGGIQDRPEAVELVAAVREYLQTEAADAVEGRVAFHARVAANVLAIVERELTHGAALDVEVGAVLRELLGHDAPVRDLVAELAARIRDGSLDDRREEVGGAVRALVEAKLRVNDPKRLGGA